MKVCYVDICKIIVLKIIYKTTHFDENVYHVSSATTLGSLKILAAACLLFVGIGSPAGVYASHIT